MNKNKSMFVGLGIFILVIISLLSVSLTMDVKAQSIVSDNSNTNLSHLIYQLNMSELNLTDSVSYFDNVTNTTISQNLTYLIDYDCELNVNNGTYLSPNGSTTNITDIITINQTLATLLSDGYHNLTLGCVYNINNTNYNLSQFNVSKFNQKTILVDTLPPIISLYNYSNFTLYNGTILLNFTISDLSTMNCTINLSKIENLTNSTLTNDTFISNIVSNTSNVSIPFNLSAGNYSYNISCFDVLNNTNSVNSTLHILDNTSIIPEVPFFSIDVSQSSFSLGELGQYTINANNNSNVTITICPIATGWVQCYTALPFVNETFPKTQTLPYTNKTGRYIISGVMRYKNITLTTNATYETSNTLTATILASATTSSIYEIINFNAVATSGVGTYTYKWTLHDGTKFTGSAAYKNYTVPGTFRVNLTVNDSVGNSYSTSIDVVVKNIYTLTIVAVNKKDNSRIGDATVSVGAYDAQTSTTGVATFKLREKSYDLYVSKFNYGSYTTQIDLDKDKTIYVNLSFQDLTPPKITLITNKDVVLTTETVDLKFQAEDSAIMSCSLYTANVNDSWYTLKDSGDNLKSNTLYTFEIRDLINGAYKWKVECVDADGNKAYSEERQFLVSDGTVTAALQSTNKNSDSINAALDNLDKLSGDESEVADLLNIKTDLQDLLDRISRVDRDVHDLSYRRDLTEAGREEAQKNLTQTIDYLKYNTPVNLRITNSKTFVKYVRDEDLKMLLDEYSLLKNLKLDKRLFLESTKRVQSKVIISTRVRNVDLYYLDGNTVSLTLVTKDISVAKPEDELTIKNSKSMSYVEVIPKTISQTAKEINMLNKYYTILKDDPLIEYPADTMFISYYINDTLNLDEFQNTDTVLIEKNINGLQSTTGMSILGIDSLSNIELGGQGIMIIVVLLLILFYIIVNFDIIDKIRNLNFGFKGFGSKKKISFIRVLINDGLDYLKTEDYDKAALVYREIKLSYEEANSYVQKEVYDESFDLCNQLDLNYALKVLDKAEYYIKMQDRNNALLEFEKLENTYHKLSDEYRLKIDERFKKIVDMIKA